MKPNHLLEFRALIESYATRYEVYDYFRERKLNERQADVLMYQHGVQFPKYLAVDTKL